MNEKQKNKFTELVNKISPPPHGGLATKMSDRFQDQSWYVKLWRYRWYLRVPFHTLRLYFKNKMANRNLKLSYSIAIGEAHLKMNWLYTLDEMRIQLKNKRKK